MQEDANDDDDAKEVSHRNLFSACHQYLMIFIYIL